MRARTGICMLLLVAALTGCGSPLPAASATAATTRASAIPPTAPATATSAPAPDRVARWREAIAAVLPGLAAQHPDPFHDTPRATIEAALARIAGAVPDLDDDAILVGLMRVFASVSATGRDGHTGLFAWGYGTYPLTSLPLRLWLFPDGVHVIEAMPPYVDLVGRRVTAIAGHPMGEVLATLDPLAPRDNPSTVRLLLPRLLLIPEVLRGAGIAGPGPTIELTLAAPGDGEATEAITPIPMGEYNDWAGPYGLFLPDDPRVRSRSRTDEALWFEDAAPGVVYVASMATDGVTSTVLTTLGARLARDDVRAVVVDARHNFGGEVGAVQPVVDTIAAVTGPGRRPRVAVWILTARNTFSAGSLLVARLARLDGAAVAGEAMGGSPSAWGNPGLVQLGDSGLEASVSTQWEVGADANDRRLTIEPDLAVDITAADVAEGRDPVLDAVIARLR